MLVTWPRLALAALAAGVPAIDPAGAALVAGLAASTLVSEDLACAGAGLLAARGETSFAAAAFACAAGIFAGDLGLFFLGRWLGRSAVRRAPLRWLVTAESLERCSRWLDERGAAVIVLSRFVPGTRLPTYVAAGVLDTSAWRFALWFLAATAVWAPALVGASMLAGLGVVSGPLAGYAGPAGAAAIALTAAAVRVGPRLARADGRAEMRRRLARLARWEFWPPWLFYPPVVAYVAWLAVRHRGLTVFTAANPGIPAGGFVGESKSQILAALDGSRGQIARFAVVPAGDDAGARAAVVARFRRELGLDYPVVLKPDVGQRGAGVRVARSDEDVAAYLCERRGDVIAQEFVDGPEFGVFYVRVPGEARGRIFSITEKRFPSVVGDGRRTLEELVLADPRASLIPEVYAAANPGRFGDVPAPGETVALVEIGSHCRGAVFLDGGWARTPALEAAIDELGRSFDGFSFGRFDLRAPSAEALMAGRGLKVLELNGVTSEATHIYDPRTGLAEAYRVIFEQWRLAFEIGARNRARGARPATAREVAALALAFARRR